MNNFNSPIIDLSKTILELSNYCAENIRPKLTYETEKENNINWVSILFEFQFLLFHLVSRRSLVRIGKEKRSLLLEEIVPIVIETTVEIIFGHWSPELKEGISNDYYENLSIAEIEYGNCQGVDPNDENYNLKDSLFHKFGYNIANYISKPLNLFTVLDVQKLILTELVDKQFNDLIDNACDYK